MYNPHIIYNASKEKFFKLGILIAKELEEQLKDGKFFCHSISYRVKSEIGFINKCMDHQKEIVIDEDPIKSDKDFLGVRIITLTLAGKEEVRKWLSAPPKWMCIQSIIDKELDGAENLHAQSREEAYLHYVGYSSMHYIIKIDENLGNEDPFQPYVHLQFELQLRTIMEHAWAETEHDKIYKASAYISSNLCRKFNLLSGALAVLDQYLDALCADVSSAMNSSREQIKSGNYTAPVTPETLSIYCSCDPLQINRPSPSSDYIGYMAAEISHMKIDSIVTLHQLIVRTYHAYSQQRNFPASTTYGDIIRLSLIDSDPYDYFENIWMHNWHYIQHEHVKYLQKNYENICELLENNKIHIIDYSTEL